MFADYSFLEGAIDLHIHVGPDYVQRYGDSITLAQEAARAGMKAIVIKTHLSSTVASAHAATRVVEGVRVFGGIALNECNGELNPRSVMATARAGGKMVWLPTVDAGYALEKAQKGHWIGHYVNGSTFGYARKGMRILDENNVLKKEIGEIINICKEYDVILGTGHISPQEALALARESKKAGFKKLEVTHPNAWLEDFTIGVLKELAELGATLSLSFGVCSPHNGRQDPQEIASVIREVGAEHCCLITDYGQTVHPSPTEGLRVYCQLLANLGIKRQEIELMTRENPARLLSI
ncbi:MAG: DUF6282 family protein [Peptococcaceae bacterium]|jgi:hypothetical protein|nr:DUF6282 family protein [Peptococcaceae bacterium]MDH7525738.1 DUF6282 family protein [Peptococcaceae bacterium]